MMAAIQSGGRTGSEGVNWAGCYDDEDDARRPKSRSACDAQLIEPPVTKAQHAPRETTPTAERE